jgi:hypothetical protein
MGKKSPCIDDEGFDYMANDGQEARDRDAIGMLMAVIIMAFLTLSQYMNWY